MDKLNIKTKLDNAIILDIQKKYVDSVASYEEIISTGFQPSIDHYINLSFLYWSFATEQIEFNLPNNIPDEMSIIGGERYGMIIEEGLQLYANSLELRFWKQYFAFRLFGSEFTFADCLLLFNMFPEDETLVPYFFLQLFDKDTYSSQIQRLIEICKSCPTAKNLYILSFLPVN